jgi:transposase
VQQRFIIITLQEKVNPHFCAQSSTGVCQHTKWYQRYSRRIEDDRLPKSKEQRAAYAQTVGEDGFLLLDLLNGPDTPPSSSQLQSVEALRQVLARHYERIEREAEGKKHSQVRFKANQELPPAAEAIESPYDLEARFRSR